MFAEYAIDCADAAHQRGLQAVAVKASYFGAAAREALFAYIDAANVDLESFTDDISPTLRRASAAGTQCPELSAPPHSGLDRDHHPADPGQKRQRPRAARRPPHFSAFYPNHKMTALPRTPAASLARARDIAGQHGLR